MKAPTPPSFEPLVAQLGWARGLARSLVHDAATADDAVQAAYEAALLHPPDTSRPVRGWLATVLRHELASRFVGDGRRRRRDQAFGTSGETQAAAPDETLGRLQTHRLLAELVEELDEPYRRTVFLRYFEEMSAVQIAEACDVPAGTVRWRLKMALDQLRQRLDERHGGQREKWRALLLPLIGPKGDAPVPPPNPAGSGAGAVLRSLVTKLAAAVGAVAVGWLVWRAALPRQPVRESGRTAVAETPRAAVARASRPPERNPVRLAPASDTLTECQDRVTGLNEALAATTKRLWETGDPTPVYEQSAPNPTAEAAIAPQNTGMLGALGRTPPPHRTECRGMFCRLVVLVPRDQEITEVLSHRAIDKLKFFDRIEADGALSSTFLVDPFSEQPLRELRWWLKLRHLDGSPRGAAAPPTSLPASPPTLAGCQAEADRLRASIAAIAARERGDGPEREAEAALSSYVARWGDMDDAFVASCRRQHPAKRWGWGQFRYSLPAAGQPNEQGQLNRISLLFEGEVVGTPFGRCIEAELRRRLATAPVPLVKASATLDTTRNFDEK